MTEDYPELEVLTMLREKNADILHCAHTYNLFHRLIQAGNKLRHLINLGSVGKPKDLDLRARYVLADFHELLTLYEPIDWQPEFQRLPYDVELQ